MATSNPGHLPLTDTFIPNTITLDNITQITTRNISSLQGAIVSPANEIMNFPSLQGTDDAQPEWWEEDHANATLTEVDTAGETITETYKRALKVVVSAAAHWAYQRFTYADQPRVKSGVSASFWCAVWSVSSASARVGLGTSTPTTSYSTPTTSAAWNLHRVDSLTLDGTYVDVILEVTAGTAYFVPLGMVIGASPPTTALSLPPRGLIYKHIAASSAIEDYGAATITVDWADEDVTSQTSPLAVIAHGTFYGEGTSGLFSYHQRLNGSSEAAGLGNSKGRFSTNALTNVMSTPWRMLLDDAQIFEHTLQEAVAGTAAASQIWINGYEEWA